MNQRGEALLFCILILTLLSGLLTLCGLELHRSYKQLEKRTKLFLCIKESKGELKQFLHGMGRTNWMIKNTSRAQYLFAVIPGLQGASLKARKIKKILQQFQQALLIKFFTNLTKIKQKACPLAPQLLLTPFKTKHITFERGPEGEALLRRKKWDYYFFQKPYLIVMNVDLSNLETPNPKINFKIKEKLGISAFPLSFH
jgi:hypothetical protein